MTTYQSFTPTDTQVDTNEGTWAEVQYVSFEGVRKEQK